MLFCWYSDGNLKELRCINWYRGNVGMLFMIKIMFLGKEDKPF